MQKYNRLFSFIIVFLLLIGFWTIIAIANFSTSNSLISNKNKLPNDIEASISINTKELINTFIFDLLFKADLNVQSAKLFIPKERQKIEGIGIDITSEVILFFDQYKDHSAKGILVNIANERDFENYKLERKNTLKKSNTQLGVILFLDEKAPVEIVNHYNKVADEIINKKNKPESEIPNNETSENLIHFTYSGKSKDYLKELNLNINIKNQTIFIKGEGLTQIDNRPKEILHHVFRNPAKSKYLEVQTKEIPKNALANLNALIDEIGINIPELLSQQLLIYGIEVVKIGKSMTFLPQFDWIFRFKAPVQIDTLLDTLHPNYKSMVDFSNKEIKLGGVRYHYKQVSENEIYLGITEKPNFEENNSSFSNVLKGNPAALMAIEGKGLFANLIQILPQVKYTKSLLDDVSHFDIHTIQKYDTLKIDGEIRLKDNQLMSVELAKYLLRLTN